MSEQATGGGSTGGVNTNSGGDGSSNASSANQSGGITVSAPAASTPNTDWTAGLNDDFKGYVQAKGFKDPSTVLDSYRNLEKLMGAPKERLLKLPEKSDDPAWSEVFTKLGRPEKPEEYGIKGDEKFSKWAQESFHKLGLSKSQGEKLVSEWNQFNEGISKSQLEASHAKAAQEDSALKAKWGQAYDKHTAIAKQAVKEFGMTADAIDKLEGALGYTGVMELMYNIGSKIGEASFVVGSKSGNNFGGVMAPEAALHEIKNLKGDPTFVEKYTKGDMEARQRLDHLHKMAYGD